MTDETITRAGPHRDRRRRLISGAIPPGVALTIGLGIFSGMLHPAWGLAAVATLVTWIFWHVREQLASTFLVFLSVLLVTAIVGQPMPKIWDDPIDISTAQHLSETWAASGVFEQDLPIVLHLVFDEMMSPGAISDDLPDGPAIRSSLYSMATDHGFRLFDSVYSRDFFSAISLPNLMIAEYLGHSASDEILTEQESTLPDNPYFADLESRGYRTAVFQTAVMDFCASSSVDLCETVDSFDPGGDGEDFNLRNRFMALSQTIVRAYQPSYASSLGARVLYTASQISVGEAGVLGIADRYDVQRFPRWFDRFAAFAATVPRGTHLFAHFMVPHAPYLLTEDCRISGRFEAGYHLATRFPPAERTPKRQDYYAAYFAQMRCVRAKLGEFLSALARRETYRDATIVIHGDHGSRISAGNVLEDYTRQDFLDNYGTFFAVRAAGLEPGVDCEFVSLGEIVRRHFTAPSLPESAGGPLPVMVISRNEGGKKVEAAMPAFGCARDDW